MLLWLLAGCIPSVGVLETRCDDVGGIMVGRRCMGDSGRAETDDSGLPTGPTERPEATPSHYVFATDETFNGNLGGLSGADAKCQLSAERAGMPGTYVAWLSNRNVAARQRVEGEGPWRNRVGWTDTVIFGAREEVVQFPASAISGTASGVRVPLSFDEVWTGTLADGTHQGTDCDNWSVGDTSVGGIGRARASNDQWTESGQVYCTNSLRLYCFSTDEVVWPFPETRPTTTF